MILALDSSPTPAITAAALAASSPVATGFSLTEALLLVLAFACGAALAFLFTRFLRGSQAKPVAERYGPPVEAPPETRDQPPAPVFESRPVVPTDPAPTLTSGPAVENPAAASAAAMRLISVRDHVLASDASEPVARDWLYARLGNVLDDLGFATIEARGAVDWATAEAVGSAPTNDAALEGTIASTVRPGYRANDVVVRPQQVIVYRKTS